MSARSDRLEEVARLANAAVDQWGLECLIPPRAPKAKPKRKPKKRPARAGRRSK